MSQWLVGNEIVSDVMNFTAGVRAIAQLAEDATVLALNLPTFQMPFIGPFGASDVIVISLGARLTANQGGSREEEKLIFLEHGRTFREVKKNTERVSRSVASLMAVLLLCQRSQLLRFGS